MGKGFKFRKGVLGNYEEMIFENHKGLRLSVLPEFGGRLNSLNLTVKKTVLDVIAGFDVADEMVIDKLYKSAILFPFPNRLDHGRYIFEGQSYQFPIDEPHFDTSLHGFLARVPFEVEEVKCENRKVSLKLAHEYLGHEDYYPFPFTFRVSYKLDEDGFFKVKFQVKNTGGKNMPMGLGWHPYFKTTGWAENVKLKLPAMNQIEVNERLLPNGQVSNFERFRKEEVLDDSKFDTCFELIDDEWKVRMRSSKNNTISIEMSADDNFRYMQVYQPPSNDSVAIEPMSSNINAFNSTMGLIILEPNGTHEAQVTIRPTSE